MKTLLKRQVLANLDYDAQVTDKKEIISTPNMQQSPEKILKLWWNVVIDVRFQDHEFGLCLLMVFLSQVFSPMVHVLYLRCLRWQQGEQKSYEIPHQISLVMIKMGLHSLQSLQPFQDFQFLKHCITYKLYASIKHKQLGLSEAVLRTSFTTKNCEFDSIKILSKNPKKKRRRHPWP